GLFSSCDAVIISDYGYGVLTPAVISALADLQRRSPRVIVADSKQLTAFRRVGLTAVKPNYTEAVQILGLCDGSTPASRAEQMPAHEERLLGATGARIAAVTLDREGAVLFERGRSPYRTYARPISRGCPSGAGDTFLAAFTLALAAGADMPAAAEIASSA